MTSQTSNLKPTVVVTLFVAAALLLGGCATVSTVESDVQSFSGATAPVQAGAFRFERLPSQSQDPQQADTLEGMAQTALQKVGFTRNEGAAARYSVQIGAETSQSVLDFPDPYLRRFAWPFGRPGSWRGQPFYASPWPDRDTYVTRVRLEIRDLGTGKVVYESTATNEESWFDAKRILPALFEATLADFPSPPKGVRKVVIKVPGK